MSIAAQKVLVLGGTGPMGSYLNKELIRLGYQVVVTSRSLRVSNEQQLSYIQGDAKDDEFLEELLSNHTFDAIVDFMLYTTDEFKTRYQLLLKNTKHYLYLSSYRVYAKSGKEKLSEDFPRLLDTLKDEKYLQTDEYALSKARQEDLLTASKKKNWTIIRPAITYSKDRFFLGSAGTDGFLYRALNHKTNIFPVDILNNQTTFTWAGDAAKMIALLIGNKKAFGEVVNVSSSEHHTWAQVLKYYKDFLSMKVKIVSTGEYVGIYKLKYMMQYNRMYHRMVDNTKVLRLTGMKQSQMMPLKDGLRMELAAFSVAPVFTAIDKEREKKIDAITNTVSQKIRSKVMLGTRLKQAKGLAKGMLKYSGAIVTLTVYNNYGNVIQRYALQRFLAKHGYRFTMFDLHSPKVKPEHQKLKNFANKYLEQESFTPRSAKYYKAYIVGSDQVWRHFSVNKKWSKFGIQFLDFVTSTRAKRIAYAASFGVGSLEAADITDELKVKITPLMKKFDAISVRESSAHKMVEQLGGPKSTQVIDPTLLLSAPDYTKLIEASKVKDTKSAPVFYYLIDPTPYIESAIAYYEEATGGKADGILPYLGPYRGIPLPSMEKWLKGIRDAEMVVTDSYHAVVFSIIFHTDFIVFDKKGGGIERILELLEPLGLEDRIIVQGDKTRYAKKHKKVDWKKVDKVLAQKRKESGDWLLQTLPDDLKKG